MALFHREKMTSSVTHMYTFGSQKTVLIVGLGNPGKEYEGTRHNIGFAALDSFAAANDFPDWIHKKDLKCELSSHTLGGTKVILIKPQTFMNLSGEAVRAVIDFYKLRPEKTLAVYDELDIPFGQIRTRLGGSSAGHNGVKSIMQHCGETFGRVRIGIGQTPKPQQLSADFVLSKFSDDEQNHMKVLLQETNSLLTEYIFSGSELAAETRTFIV